MASYLSPFYWIDLLVYYLAYYGNIIVFDIIVPTIQKMVPGSPTSIWSNSVSWMLFLLTFLIITRVYLEKWVYN